MTVWIILTTALQGISYFSSLYTDQQTRTAAGANGQAAEAQRRAAEAMENAYRDREIVPRTVQIPGNAFNAGTTFTSVFTTTAIIGIAILAQGVDELREIRNELHAQTTAMVQGWQNEGFGAFIYDFLKSEIVDCGGEESVGKHVFYVYNATTSADVGFKQKVRDGPLPASFGGFSSDIEAIFRLMWANRQTLRATMSRDAADAVVFHLLVPAKRTMVISERMLIHESIGKLVIKGHTEEGSCYVRFNFVAVPRQVILHDICNIDTDSESENKCVTSWKAAVACWVGSAVCSIAFPPAAPWFIGGFLVSWGSIAKYGPIDALMRSELRVLGPPLEVIALTEVNEVQQDEDPAPEI